MKKKRGQTTTEENEMWQRTYYQHLLALDELTEDDINKACVYGGPLRNYLGLVDIKNHRAEDNMNSSKFRERATTVDNMLNLLGFKRVKATSNIEKDDL